jgi:hypothetical protein
LNHGADFFSLLCCEGAGYVRWIFLVKKALFGDNVLENQQLANVHNIDDDGIARLKTETELREQNNSPLCS